MRIRALLMAVAFGGAALATAEAADQSATAAKAPSYYPNTYYPPATMWTGFYVGLHIGGAWGNGSWTDPYSRLGDRPGGSGVLGGAQFGVNGQSDWLVYGLEIDFSGTNLSASASSANATGVFNHTIESSWFSTGTARVGYATGPWLLYGKGGAAVTDEKNTVTNPMGMTAVGRNFHLGWTVGGGVEYALTHNWSTRIEYDYVDFKNDNELPLVSPLTLQTGFTNSPNVNWTIHRVVGAVNYRF